MGRRAGGVGHGRESGVSSEAIIEQPATPRVDLQAYFARIGYSGPLAPRLETLAALQELHPAAIPFEAIDVLLGRGIDISPAAVDAKLLGARRGGYCYEQNGLFKRVLQAIGFQVEGLSARVNWMAAPDDPLRPPTHMALRVTIDGVPWLADVGFGTCVPTAPLRLDSTEPQPTAHETFRIVPVAGELQLEALVAEAWAPLYRLTRSPLLDVDYELANWYTATHPNSRFRHQLIVTRTTPAARHVLAGPRLTIRSPDGAVEQRLLDANEIEQELRERFGLPVEPEWRGAIEKACVNGC
jgi:N-hydroxyarylamine O-acetyltransferase